MAEQGNFRTALNGFNKSDVLEYIDAMQSRYVSDLEVSQRHISDLQNSIHAQQADRENLKNQIERLEGDIAGLQEENEKLKQTAQDKSRYASDIRRLAQEVEILRLEKKEYTARLAELQEYAVSADALERQVEALKAQTGHNSSMRQADPSEIEEANTMIGKLKHENEELQAKLKYLQERSAELESNLSRESNFVIERLKNDNQMLAARLKEAQEQIDELQTAGEAGQQYKRLIGDAGAFVMEMYSMGQHFLELAFKRSDGCLESMEESLSILSAQTCDARDKVKNARQALLDYGSLAGLRLDEMMQTLECSAGNTSDAPPMQKTEE